MSRVGCGTRRLPRLGVAPAVAADAGGRLSRRTDPPNPCPQPGHLWRATRACRAPAGLGRPCQPQTGRPADARPRPAGRPPPPAPRHHTPRPDRTGAGPGRTELPAARAGPAVGGRHRPAATGEGWLYLAVILDAFSRRVVGWSMAEHLRTELVLDAPRHGHQPAATSTRPGLSLRPRLSIHRIRLRPPPGRLRTRRLDGDRRRRMTTPSPRASSPPWNASSSTATPGRPERAYGRRSSTSSRSSTTANAATRPSTTIHPPPTSSTTIGNIRSLTTVSTEPGQPQTRLVVRLEAIWHVEGVVKASVDASVRRGPAYQSR